jgi:hypothetical protein
MRDLVSNLAVEVIAITVEITTILTNGKINFLNIKTPSKYETNSRRRFQFRSDAKPTKKESSMKSFLIIFSSLALSGLAAFASSCPDTLEIKLESPQLKPQDESLQTEANGLVIVVNNRVLKNTGEDGLSGCMYESDDKAVFADLMKSELTVYPGDMYTKPGPKNSLDEVNTVFFDFALVKTPKFKIKAADVIERRVLGNASDAGREDDLVLNKLLSPIPHYQIKLSSGDQSIIVKK